MTELERSLARMAPEIAWPPAPDVALRLEPRPLRRQLLVAVALAVLAVGIAFAVPPARSAILRLFHLGGVTIVRVETLPPTEERSLAADLGVRVSPADAAFQLGQPFRLPPEAAGAPLYELDGVVSALLAAREPLLLSELGGTGLVKKLVGASTSVESVQIAPEVDGLWLSGGPHVFIGPQAPPRLAGNVLLWERGGITFRLEGRNLAKDTAVRLAREIDGTSER